MNPIKLIDSQKFVTILDHEGALDEKMLCLGPFSIKQAPCIVDSSGQWPAPTTRDNANFVLTMAGPYELEF